jgi:hypothetical protein
MDTSILWRSALVQLVLVGVIFVVLAIALPHSFFDDWGWLTGPLAWIGCAGLTARILSLPLGNTLLGAVLVGIPDAICVVIGLHELGGVIAIVLFGLWCARRPRRRTLTA